MIAPEIQEFINILLKALIPIVTYFVTVKVSAYYEAKRAQVEASLSTEQLYAIKSAIDFAVQGAEQSGVKNLILNEGYNKKQWAINAAQKMLSDIGLPAVSAATLANLVEAALNQGAHKPYQALPASVGIPITPEEAIILPPADLKVFPSSVGISYSPLGSI